MQVWPGGARPRGESLPETGALRAVMTSRLGGPSWGWLLGWSVRRGRRNSAILRRRKDHEPRARATQDPLATPRKATDANVSKGLEAPPTHSAENWRLGPCRHCSGSGTGPG
jgi:hypothetical protein